MIPASLIVRASGLLLALVAFLPLDRLYRLDTGARLVYVPPEEWLLGLALFGVSAFLIARYVPAVPRALETAAIRLDGRVSSGAVSLAGFLLLGAVLIATSWYVFRHRPLLVDSVVQLFQAKIFAAGRLTAPAPPDEAFVATQHMIVHDGRWFAQYPPGHAALLSVGVGLGAAWLVPVGLSVATALTMYRFAARAWDERTGRLTLLLFGASPFFWAMGASFMNHVTCLFFVALFLLAFRAWEDDGADRWAFAAGLAIGAAGLARPLTAVAVAAVFAPIGAHAAWRMHRPRGAWLAVAGGLLPALAYLAWNVATTGDALQPGYLALWGASHGIGFHVSPWGEAHTPGTGLRNQLLDLSLLGGFLFEWPIPALLPAGLYGMLTGGKSRWDRRMFVAVLALPVAYFFYWHRDAYLGPRFLYTSLAFAVPLTARAILATASLRRRGRLAASTLGMLVVLCLAYTLLYSGPRRLAGHAGSFASMKHDLVEEASQHGIDEGTIFVAVSWGNRLLARMRGAGVSASTAEAVYRRADHCRIEETLRDAVRTAATPDRLEAAMRDLPSEGEQSPLNGDPTLRLVPGRPLTLTCAEELAYDAAGYTNWLPYLLANDPDLGGRLLVVRDLRDASSGMSASWPREGPVWLYRPGRFYRAAAGGPATE